MKDGARPQSRCLQGRNRYHQTPPVAAATPCAAKPYPLATCLVSGEKLGEMGKSFEIVYEGQQIKFCCKNCAPKFAKDPAKYL